MKKQDGTEELKRPAVFCFLVNTTNILFILITVTQQNKASYYKQQNITEIMKIPHEIP